VFHSLISASLLIICWELLDNIRSQVPDSTLVSESQVILVVEDFKYGESAHETKKDLFLFASKLIFRQKLNLDSGVVFCEPACAEIALRVLHILRVINLQLPENTEQTDAYLFEQLQKKRPGDRGIQQSTRSLESKAWALFLYSDASLLYQAIKASN